MRRRGAQGFSLLEVVIALAIMSLSLVVLLQAQGQALASAIRSKDLTIATVLARGKMIDIEQKLFHDGFVMNDVEDDGDFADEGFADIKWKSRISEVELDLSTLQGLCAAVGGQTGKSSDKEEQARTDCESTMASIGGMLSGLTEEVARSIRAVELEVVWADGRYNQNMRLRALVTRDDFAMQQESDAARANDQLKGMLPDAAGTAGAPGAAGASPGVTP
jgi:general secretion pathway protein I